MIDRFKGLPISEQIMKLAYEHRLHFNAPLEDLDLNYLDYNDLIIDLGFAAASRLVQFDENGEYIFFPCAPRSIELRAVKDSTEFEGLKTFINMIYDED